MLAQDSPTQVQDANPYAPVEAIFSEYCFDCHSSVEPEADLVMETFELLMKGGTTGPSIVPGNSAESLLVRMIEGRIEKDGKKQIMPPGRKKKLSPAEIETIRTWIDLGAPPPPNDGKRARKPTFPKIAPTAPLRRAVNALDYTSRSKLIAVARYGVVELWKAENRAIVRKLDDHAGSINSVKFSTTGEFIFAGGGDAGVSGEVRQWRISDGTLVRLFEGHRDSIYTLDVSPDGKILATGSYDHTIKLWEIETGLELHNLKGHNGAIFDLSFRPDGKILASASADRTVKLWDVSTGERRDTLSQSLKELHTVAFNREGTRLAAGGVDKRIRVWEISKTADETTNPLIISRFAHEGAILGLLFSEDGKSLLSSASDKTVKIWEAEDVREKLLFEEQPDWVPASTFSLDDQVAIVGRADGTVQFYSVANGEIKSVPKPTLTRLKPRGVQRGSIATITLIGSNLVGLTQVKFQDPRIKSTLSMASEHSDTEASASLTLPPDLPRGAYTLSLISTNGESGRVTLHVDDIPQLYISEDSNEEVIQLSYLPASIWGTHKQLGNTENFSFQAREGQTLVFDVAAKRIGSKSSLLLALLDNHGRVLASSSGFDDDPDPFLAFRFPKTGKYMLRLSDLVLGASNDHYYRLSIGEFPYVTGIYPLSVELHRQSTVTLLGWNLPENHMVTIEPKQIGEIDVPFDSNKFRSRRGFNVTAGNIRELLETEPNNTPSEAATIEVPCSVNGTISAITSFKATETRRLQTSAGDSDQDLYRFNSREGQIWIIETAAARHGSPVDTKIEVLHSSGAPVSRALLRAVRDSNVTFRGIDSVTADCRVENWEEMELNQYLYLQGEVVKLFRAPRGPDSGFQFYTLNGKRRNYFDTSATAHANQEPCYIVEPHPHGTRLSSNGLPVFPVNYTNDDDADRKLGTDSKLTFTAPESGSYLIRVTDSRGFGGARFVYRLKIRKAEPSFHVTLKNANLTVNRGSGQSFTVSAERIDGFEGEIDITLENLPDGFTASSPLIIETGHTQATGTLNADLDAPEPTSETATNSVVKAVAIIDGKQITKSVNNFGRIRLGKEPELYVTLSPAPVFTASTDRGSPGIVSELSATAKDIYPEITILPGQSVSAWLQVKRNGHDDLVTFNVNNLPHGVIIDNIGLNGVLIPRGQNEREIFLTAAKWVSETDRLCYAISDQAGRQTSLPVILRIRPRKTTVSSIIE